MTAQVAVLRLPGVNGEEEAVRACRHVGLEAALVPWTESSRTLARYDAFILPGGFSYQDRVRAGAVGARHRLLDAVRERAAGGAPVLGLCNGAQVLVESGLVPEGGAPMLALAPNRMPDREGYHARWIWCRVAESPCLFTQAYAPGEWVPMPVAHGEGRFFTASPERWERWRSTGQVPLAYAAPVEGGEAAPEFPWNPNGAQANAAGVCNARGNVLALMPHPERGEALSQVPLDLPGPWGERRRAVADAATLLRSAGPGRGVFVSLAMALGGHAVTAAAGAAGAAG